MKQFGVKKTILGLSIVSVALLIGWASFIFSNPSKSAGSDGPQISITEPTFDFGAVAPGEQIVHEFIVTNKGNAELEIKDVRPT